MTSKKDLLAKVIQLRNDPLEFLKGVRTLDESDPETPIKYFPWEKDYIQLYVEVWMKNRWILVPKSRRMQMSWTNIALYTWDTMFHKGRKQAFVSKKEDDSDDLVKRAKFIIDNLDHNIIPKEIVPKYEYVFCNLKFPQIMSSIEGYPSGADQLRQYTFSGILADEMAFWPNAEDMYSAAFPTLQGSGGKTGGRFTGISSAAPGFFKAMVFDGIDKFGQEAHNE